VKTSFCFLAILISSIFTFTLHAQDAPPVTAPARGFQITTNHSGATTTTTLKLPLAVKWSVSLPGTASYPIITQGKVYVVSAGNGTIPSTLYALNETTGATLWSQPIPAGFGGWIGAAYDRGALFLVTTANPSFGSGAMFAFSAVDGHQIWSANLPGQYSFSSAPTALNGIVYTGGAGSGGTVYAVSESNGLVLWTASVQNGDSSAPAVTSNGVYVSYACPQSYRFDPKTGVQTWHFSGPCEGGGGESAAVFDGFVFVRDIFNYPTDGLMLNATTGAIVSGFNSTYSPAFLGKNAFYTEPNTTTAVNLTTGKTVWTAVASAGETFSCSPIVVNGVVFAATSMGNVIGYSAGTGKKVSTTNVGTAVSCGEYFAIPLAGMSAGDGYVVVPAGNKLVALQ